MAVSVEIILFWGKACLDPCAQACESRYSKMGPSSLRPNARIWLLSRAGHYCLTRSIAVAEISATQSVNPFEFVWSALVGRLMFADVPTESTVIGGAVICAAALSVAQCEASLRR